MKITQIEQKSGSRYTVYVDGEYWYILDIELIAANGLREGMDCDPEFLEAILLQAQRRKGKERALYLLEYRDHTRKELVDKLVRSVSREIAEETADRMEELGLIDDQRYARRVAAFLLEQKQLGRRAALYKMQQKGFSRAVAEEALQEVEVDPAEQIRQMIDRRYARYLTDRKGVQKVTDALARMGHRYADIKAVIQEYYEDAESFE